MTDMPKEQLIAEAQQVVEREAVAVTSLTAQFDDSLPAVLDMLLNCKGHVLVTGMGTSGAVAERFAHLLSCCGTPALFIHAADSLHGTSGAITANDVVYIISKGGQSAEINQFADIARARGARLIAHTEDPTAPLAGRCDLVFQIKAPAGIDPFELIATGSSLVNAAACDALCVLLLRLRGYTKADFGMTHPGGAVGKILAETQG